MNHNLPIEIWHHVLQFSQNRYQCALVCKAWKEVALQQLYKDLRLDGYNVYCMKKLFKLDADEQAHYFRYFFLTTKLTIDRDHERMTFDTTDYLNYQYSLLEEDDFILFLEMLPKLQVVNLNNSFYEHYYFGYIRDTNSRKCLNEVQTFCSATFHDFKTSYRYRATLTTLNHTLRIEYYLPTPTMNICQSLSQFKNLTSLTFVNAYVNNLTPLELQLACPCLVTLKYSCRNRISDQTIQNLLRDNDMSKTNSRLKILQLHIPNLPVSYFQYVSGYLVPHLDSLDLQINRSRMYDWISDVGIENALTFAKNIGSLKQSGFGFQCPYEDVIVEDKNAEMTVFYKLLNAFKGSKHRICEATFKFVGNPSYSMQRSKNNLIQFEYPLDVKCYSPPIDSKVVHAYDLALNEYLPDKAVSISGPEIIDCLNIYAGCGNPELAFVFIQYALIYCPNLLACRIVMDAISNKNIYIGTHVKELQLRKDRFITSKYGREDIKVFKSFHLIPSQATLDLLCINLPNIQALICGANFMYGRWTQKVAEIDLKLFKNLELFQFDDYNICGNDTDYIFIRLQVDNGDMAYYSRRNGKTVVYEAATLQLFQEYQDDATLNNCLLTVKCNSGVKFIVSSGNHTMAAEFDNGLLLDCIGINANFL
ncbi:uncharacterized protein EV154DRAFT_524333 [Mucor mucedo]|uniref:uncharacterized protein n=1 Tax=Mucor mucedo TaxID=29922 RepID=UPI002221250B|nr:uncharacterized protein EV154DRAFT_524333 [Mucor mucedo]KAI7879862.1 hypothetical protein EV154DRAFT_524333 [Mucor mucedo]